MLAQLKAELEAREKQGLLRRRRELQSPQSVRVLVDGAQYLSFCSNDYLGLANHPALVLATQQALASVGLGSGASHLITGHHQAHEQAEQALANFVGMPAALSFSSGYLANLAVISGLLGREDAVFADKLNHACLNDGAALSRAQFQRFAHNDANALESLLKKSTAKRKLVAVDAVFSMDGDIAPLADYLALCERYDAYLYIDDAHGFGVLGAQGRGVLRHFGLASGRLIYMATLGKAAGVAGAFVAGPKVVIDYLLQFAKPYIYTTASPPALAVAVQTSLALIQAADAQRAHMRDLMGLFCQHLALKHWQAAPSPTAILPLMVGTSETAVQLSEYLRTRGILVPAIRPPTVPNNTARLRISFSASHGVQDVLQCVKTINQAESELMQ